MIYKERKIPAPSVNPENKPYFDAASKGKLLVKKCSACGEFHQVFIPHQSINPRQGLAY